MKRNENHITIIILSSSTAKIILLFIVVVDYLTVFSRTKEIEKNRECESSNCLESLSRKSLPGSHEHGNLFGDYEPPLPVKTATPQPHGAHQISVRQNKFCVHKLLK